MELIITQEGVAIKDLRVDFGVLKITRIKATG